MRRQKTRFLKLHPEMELEALIFAYRSTIMCYSNTKDELLTPTHVRDTTHFVFCRYNGVPFCLWYSVECYVFRHALPPQNGTRSPMIEFLMVKSSINPRSTQLELPKFKILLESDKIWSLSDPDSDYRICTPNVIISLILDIPYWDLSLVEATKANPFLRCDFKVAVVIFPVFFAIMHPSPFQ